MGIAREGRARLGSWLLLGLAAALVLRPWEDLGGSGPAGPAAVWARVVRVIDGDTFDARLLGAGGSGRVESVRMIGVDTPETVDPDEPVGCFGPRASRFSKGRLSGRRVRLVLGVERRDDYGRLLAYVHLDGRLFNAELLRGGFARTLTIAPNDRFAKRFKRLEIRAGRAGRGLWGRCSS